MNVDGHSEGGTTSPLTDCLRWKPGVELPPFVSSNTEVLQLLSDLVAGVVDNIDRVEVSDAVVVQIYELVFKSKVLAPLRGR